MVRIVFFGGGGSPLWPRVRVAAPWLRMALCTLVIVLGEHWVSVSYFNFVFIYSGTALYWMSTLIFLINHDFSKINPVSEMRFVK